MREVQESPKKDISRRDSAQGRPNRSAEGRCYHLDVGAESKDWRCTQVLMPIPTSWASSSDVENRCKETTWATTYLSTLSGVLAASASYRT